MTRPDWKTLPDEWSVSGKANPDWLSAEVDGYELNAFLDGDAGAWRWGVADPGTPHTTRAHGRAADREAAFAAAEAAMERVKAVRAALDGLPGTTGPTAREIVLALVFQMPPPADYPDLASAWRRLLPRQRAVVMEFHPEIGARLRALKIGTFAEQCEGRLAALPDSSVPMAERVAVFAGTLRTMRDMLGKIPNHYPQNPDDQAELQAWIERSDRVIDGCKTGIQILAALPDDDAADAEANEVFRLTDAEMDHVRQTTAAALEEREKARASNNQADPEWLEAYLKPKRGRPAVAGQAMTGAERTRLSRARKREDKGLAEVALQIPADQAERFRQLAAEACAAHLAPRYEIEARPAELGGGWRLRLMENGQEAGGGVYPPEGSGQEATDAAHAAAVVEGEEWLITRRA